MIIHGSALTRDQLGDVKDAGAKLVWSPQSNLRLYGETTRAADALALDLPLGLGADWLPSGSTSLLAELKVARRVLRDQGARPTAKKLVDMVTRDAASIAGLDDKLGTLKAGRPADLVVLERRVQDPWENVVEADPSWVELVMIDGDLAYGRADWLEELTDPGAQGGLEPLSAWGKQMLLDTSYAARPGTDGRTEARPAARGPDRRVPAGRPDLRLALPPLCDRRLSGCARAAPCRCRCGTRRG